MIGPVRSARTTDSDLIRLFGKAVFGYSGANGRVNAIINRTPGAVALSYDRYGGLFHRSGSRPAPHNVYTSTSTLVQAALRNHPHLKAPRRLFAYARTTKAGTKARSLYIRWSGFASAGWGWNGQVWRRSQNGRPDMLVSGHRVGAANVVVMQIKTRYMGLHDVLGNPSPDDVVTGSGKVYVFRSGRMIIGKWTRHTARSKLRLRDGKGRALRLAPGRTWIELLPPQGSLTHN